MVEKQDAAVRRVAEPSRGLRPVAFRMRARKRAVSFEAGRPGRWGSTPSTPCRKKRAWCMCY